MAAGVADDGVRSLGHDHIARYCGSMRSRGGGRGRGGGLEPPTLSRLLTSKASDSK
jgi:hypothetical protein